MSTDTASGLINWENKDKRNCVKIRAFKVATSRNIRTQAQI